eukprot:767286-Hanusia_phi.AAC.2
MRPDPTGTAMLSSTSMGPPVPSCILPQKVSGMAPGEGMRGRKRWRSKDWYERGSSKVNETRAEEEGAEGRGTWRAGGGTNAGLLPRLTSNAAQERDEEERPVERKTMGEIINRRGERTGEQAAETANQRLAIAELGAEVTEPDAAGGSEGVAEGEIEDAEDGDVSGKQHDASQHACHKEDHSTEPGGLVVASHEAHRSEGELAQPVLHEANARIFADGEEDKQEPETSQRLLARKDEFVEASKDGSSS